jgi:hypothetical protein
MPNRFVILHHRLAEGEHWDLMLEHGDVLLTWRLPDDPVGRSSLPMPTRRIEDHRKAFLEYEGGISRDRGRVSRVDTGSVVFEEFTEDRIAAVLHSDRLSGRFTLTAEGDQWTFEAVP